MVHIKNMHFCENIGKMLNPKNILLSRTDAIGDVCLTLPICMALKEKFPTAKLTFLCTKYTRAVVDCFSSIDAILTLEEIQALGQNDRMALLGNFDVVVHVFPNKQVAAWCKKAKIAMRIGTSHRLFHWFYCNQRPRFSRIHSPIHEAQLNFKLLIPLGILETPSLEKINANLSFLPSQLELDHQMSDWQNVILMHPKSNGSGVEYDMGNYIKLAKQLSSKGYLIFFTGTEKEGSNFREQIPNDPRIFDFTGKWDLPSFIAVISKVKALVACSTGPYHIAGLSGIRAIGLFSQRNPVHSGRWAALGPKVVALTARKSCKACASGKNCQCIQEIELKDIIHAIES